MCTRVLRPRVRTARHATVLRNRLPTQTTVATLRLPVGQTLVGRAGQCTRRGHARKAKGALAAKSPTCGSTEVYPIVPTPVRRLDSTRLGRSRRQLTDTRDDSLVMNTNRSRPSVQA